MYSGHTVLRANSITANILQGEQEIVLLASILIVVVQDVPRIDNATPVYDKACQEWSPLEGLPLVQTMLLTCKY